MSGSAVLVRQSAVPQTPFEGGDECYFVEQKIRMRVGAEGRPYVTNYKIIKPAFGLLATYYTLLTTSGFEPLEQSFQVPQATTFTGIITSGFLVDTNSPAAKLKKSVEAVSCDSRTQDAKLDGEQPVTTLTERLARLLADSILDVGWPMPQVRALATGRVGFVWNNLTETAMMSIGDDGWVRLSANIDGGHQISEAWLFTEALPESANLTIAGHFGPVPVRVG